MSCQTCNPVVLLVPANILNRGRKPKRSPEKVVMLHHGYPVITQLFFNVKLHRLFTHWQNGLDYHLKHYMNNTMAIQCLHNCVFHVNLCR